MNHFDVLIIGSGAAGLTVALGLAGGGYRIALITKGELLSGSTAQAQGGIAAVTSEEDSFFEHERDTWLAGDKLGNLKTIRYVVKEAPRAISWLQEQKVEFTKKGGEFHLTREGGHQRCRILHTRDATGREIASKLITQLKQTETTILTYWAAVDLVVEKNRAVGVKYFNLKEGNYGEIRATFIVLATGGVNRIYRVMTSETQNYGAGIAMAIRAGVKVENLAFHQFHPTAFYNKPFLISESVRGEGGCLTIAGKSFMEKYNVQGDLAPRDVVTRAIIKELEINSLAHADLDLSRFDPQEIPQRFPEIYHFCKLQGIDITQTTIPVTPAAHYACGGIVTNLQGRTSLSNLYAVGEVACTGLHGANRLASNSLVECIVLGRAVSEDILSRLGVKSELAKLIPQGDLSIEVEDEEFILPSLMWEKVGIIRSNQDLLWMKNWLCKNFNRKLLLKRNLRVIEKNNLFTVAISLVDSALAQKQNRGCHYNQDLV